MGQVRGGSKVCPVCGVSFEVDAVSEWSFIGKRKRENGKGFEKIYLCSYKCKRQHEKDFPIKERRSVK